MEGEMETLIASIDNDVMVWLSDQNVFLHSFFKNIIHILHLPYFESKSGVFTT